MTSFDFRLRTRVVFGAGEFSRIGELARELGGTRCLLVADPSAVEARSSQEAVRALKARRMEVFAFHELGAEPDTKAIAAGLAFAAPLKIDLVVGLGGAGALDAAKAINLLLSNGGSMPDYWGYGKARQQLLAMLAVPTAAGSGSEAQSHAAIVNSETGEKMICGDPKILFRTAVLDPKLTLSRTGTEAAADGYQALAYTLDTIAANRSTPFSECFSREAWNLLNRNFSRMVANPDDLEARGGMLLAAHMAGLAVENSMLGVAHACAQPLAARYKFSEGTALAPLLARVVDWIREEAAGVYDGLCSGDLARHLDDLVAEAELPGSLETLGVAKEALPRLAEEAAAQWSARSCPRAFTPEAALEIYTAAY